MKKSIRLLSNNHLVVSQITPADWLSPTLERRRTAPLNFLREAQFFALFCAKYRRSNDLLIIDNLAKHIEFVRKTRAIVAIPAHVGETGLGQTIRSILSETRDMNSLEIVVLLNADKTISKKQFSINRDARINEIERTLSSVRGSQRRRGARFTRVTVVSHHFRNSVKMGQVRGCLVDAIVKSAHAAKLIDPLLISHDADQLAVSKNYYKVLLQTMRRDSEIDAGEGVIRWGDSRDRIEMPELLLNEVVSRYFDLRPNKKYRGPRPALHGYGANSFFRLATYCAVGGYDYTLKSGEDLELLQRIEIARIQGRGQFVGFYGQNVRLLPSLEITTNARNLAQSIVSGKALLTELNHFNLSGHLSIEPMIRKYTQRRSLIQKDDMKFSRPLQAKIEKKNSRNHLNARCFDA